MQLPSWLQSCLKATGRFAVALPGRVYKVIKVSIVLMVATLMAGALFFLGSMVFTKPIMVKSIQKAHSKLQPLIPADVYGVKNTVVRIYDSEGEFECSGVVVGKNYVLTAAHCLVDMDEGIPILEKKMVTIENVDQSVRVAGMPVAVNTRLDWGLIEGNFSDIPAAHVLTTDYGIGDSKFMHGCGYPQGSQTLRCELLMPVINDAFIIKCANGVLQPGMSGGPVFNDKGQVVGLNILVYPAYAQGGGSGYTPTMGIFSCFGIGSD